MKNIKRSKKVELQRETVRTLSEQQVVAIAGGGTQHPQSGAVSCNQH
jgi:hypothetical protein